jgi:hypothetical protein
MKVLKYRLVLDVDFDRQDAMKEDLKDNLWHVVRDAVNNGTLSGVTGAYVLNYKASVKERRKRKKTMITNVWLT